MKDRWDLLLDDAIAAIHEDRSADWEPPADVVKLFPGSPQQCKVFLLASAWERWVTTLGPQG